MLDRKIGEIAGSRLYAKNLEFRLADHGTGSICYTASSHPHEEDEYASLEPTVGRYQGCHAQILHVPTCSDYDEV